MFFCRKVRLLPLALDEGWNSMHAQVKANRLGDFTWSLRNSSTFTGPRTSGGYISCRDLTLELSPCNKREGDMFTAKNYCVLPRFVTPHREHLTRLTSISPSPFRTQHKSNVKLDNIRCKCLPVHISVYGNGHKKLDTVQSLLFTSGTTLSSTRFPTAIVHMRAYSTAVKHKREAGAGEDAVTGIKEQDQNPAQPSSSSSPEAPEPGPEDGKPSKTQQLKKVFKEYGAVGVSFHICISLMSLGMFYLAVSSGIDIVGLLCQLGFSESVVQSKMAAGTSTFVLAYAVHKLFAPVRISITLVSVPFIVRHFRKTGLFKPRASSP